MKRLLLLGAMQMHVPIIKRARERGIYVITCDYVPENEGHRYSDEAYYDSTTDFESVLGLARRCKVDGVMTFNSDPAALTAAYVSTRLGLPTSGLSAVEIMSQKDRFRKFLSEKGFNVPKFGNYSDLDTLLGDLDNYRFPIMLKPVDSSGSKGVAKIDAPVGVPECFSLAMSFSRCKRVIVEEFIEPFGPQVHGDGFVYDGNVEFVYLGDHHFDSGINNLVPVSTTFPSTHLLEDMECIEREVQRFISEVGFKQGGINVEARISSLDRKVYLIEVGARNGGNFTPRVIQYASGFNFMDACLDGALGFPFHPQPVYKAGYYAYMILHSSEDGILADIFVDSVLESKILERHYYLRPGDEVKSFKGSNSAVGVLLVRFDTAREMMHYVDCMNDYCKVILKD